MSLSNSMSQKVNMGKYLGDRMSVRMCVCI